MNEIEVTVRKAESLHAKVLMDELSDEVNNRQKRRMNSKENGLLRK
jgi:hypothetical protein